MITTKELVILLCEIQEADRSLWVTLNERFYDCNVGPYQQAVEMLVGAWLGLTDHQLRQLPFDTYGPLETELNAAIYSGIGLKIRNMERLRTAIRRLYDDAHPKTRI